MENHTTRQFQQRLFRCRQPLANRQRPIRIDSISSMKKRANRENLDTMIDRPFARIAKTTRISPRGTEEMRPVAKENTRQFPGHGGANGAGQLSVIAIPQEQ